MAKRVPQYMLSLDEAKRLLLQSRLLAKAARSDVGWRTYYLTWALTYRRSVRRLNKVEDSLK